MKFKNWKEQYKFIDEYATASCYNCKYGGKIKDSDDDRTYMRKFCRKFIAMVEFKFQFLCAEWESEDGKTLEDYGDCPLFRIDDDLLDSMDTDYEWTFEEIKEKVDEEAKK